MTEPTTEQALTEFTAFLQGETMALRVAIHALITSHPNQKALAEAFRHAMAGAHRDWAAAEPAARTRFRAEQMMEELAASVRT